MMYLLCCEKLLQQVSTMSFIEIKKSIALLILEIKRLDPTSKYSIIVHLEETIDILKLEALKELPQSQFEEDIKDEDISSDNLNDYEEMIMNDYEENESKTPDKAKDERIENNHVSNTNHQELNEEREHFIQVSDTEIKKEPKSVPPEDPIPSDTVVKDKDDEKKAVTSGYVCKICQMVLENRRGLMIHYNNHGGKFKCHICKEPFIEKRELDKHISNHVNCLKLQKIRAYAKLRPRQVSSMDKIKISRFSSKLKTFYIEY